MFEIDTNLSSGYYVDTPRENIQPIRSQSMSVANWTFDTLTGWTNISGSGATATISDPGSSDPAIGKVLDLKTNGTLGATAGVQKVQNSIPASYGYMVIVNLTAVGSSPSDALHINIQNSANYVLSTRFYNNALEVFQDGDWRQLIAHGGAYDTEWWLECHAELDGTHTVGLYAGTARIVERNGYLPTGIAGNTNLLWIQQFSGVNTNRRSKVAILQIGATQLSDPMTLVSKPQVALFPPSVLYLTALVENICQDLSGLSGYVSTDGGNTWQIATLENKGRFGTGVIDVFKDVVVMSAAISPSNTEHVLKWKLETTLGAFLSIRDVHLVYE